MSFQIEPLPIVARLAVSVDLTPAAVLAVGNPAPDGLPLALGRLPFAIASAVADVFAAAGVDLAAIDGATITVTEADGGLTFTGEPEPA